MSKAIGIKLTLESISAVRRELNLADSQGNMTLALDCLERLSNLYALIDTAETIRLIDRQNELKELIDKVLEKAA